MLQEVKSAQKQTAESLREDIEAWMQTKLDEAGGKIKSALESVAAAKQGNSEMVAHVEKQFKAALQGVQQQIDAAATEQRQFKEKLEHWRDHAAATLRSLEAEKDNGWCFSLEIQGGLEVLAQRTAASLDNIGARLQEHQNATVEGFKSLEGSIEQQVRSNSITLRKTFGEDLKALDSENQSTLQALKAQATTMQSDLIALQGAFNTQRDAAAQLSLQESKRLTNVVKASSEEIAKALTISCDGARAEQAQLKQTIEGLIASHDERVQGSIASMSEQVKWLTGAFERGEADATRRHEQTHAALSAASSLATSAKEEAVSATQRVAASEITTRGALSQRDSEIRSLVEGLARLRSQAGL